MAFTKEELAQMAEYDKLVDKGIDLYPLTKEQEKNSKKARSTGTKTPTVYKFTQRERKPNDDKREIMEKLKMGITLLAGEPVSTTIEVTNPEREMEFTFHGKKYRVTLSAPRK